MLRRRNRHLIVPVHDRRRHVRILTLKNFGWAMLVIVVAFAAISIRSELSSTEPRPGDYGRLYGNEVPPVEQDTVEVVHEAGEPVDDQASADPMMIEPLHREQWLRDDGLAAAPTAPQNRVEAGVTRGRIAIVGDAGGVAIVQRDRAKPELSGGFGRRP